jgi:hypothetical protein
MNNTFLKYMPMVIAGLLLLPNITLAQRDTDGLSSPKTTVVHHKPKEAMVDCNLGRSYNKNICSNIEDNKAYLIKYQLQSKSGMNSSAKIKDWTQT